MSALVYRGLVDNGKAIYKCMRTRGSPILGNLHMNGMMANFCEASWDHNPKIGDVLVQLLALLWSSWCTSWFLRSFSINHPYV